MVKAIDTDKLYSKCHGIDFTATFGPVLNLIGMNMFVGEIEKVKFVYN